MHRLAALTLCLTLGACQSPNPYRAESAPLPPAPEVAGAVEPGVYPAAPRDYAGYRDWAWQDDRPPGGGAGLEAGQVQEALSAELDRRGLRPVRPGATADLQVAARLGLEWRIRAYEDYYGSLGGYYGYGHGHHHDHDHYGYGAWGAVPIVRSYEEQVLVVRVELSDGADGQPVWSGSGEARTDDDSGQRADALRQAVRRALKGFPS